jgi:hypothetical protein
MKNTNKYDNIKTDKGTENLPTANPYHVPDGYFENLTEQINDKIHASNPSAIKSVFGINLPVMKIAAAAGMIAIAVSLLYFLTGKPEQGTADAVITYEQLYHSDMMDELDESLLINSYISDAEDAGDETGSDSNDMDDYLIENNIDLSLIINEL